MTDLPSAHSDKDVCASLIHCPLPYGHDGPCGEQRAEYRQAALELYAEIRHGIAWIGSGCEPSVAYAAMLKAADRWRALLEDADV